MSIQLDEEDLLDIDGSDDPTTAFSANAVLAKLRAPLRKKRSAFAQGGRGGPVDDPTVVLDRDDVRETIPIPMNLAALLKPSSAPPAAAAPVPGSIAPKSPTISPAPPVRTRNANSSYPPMAVSLGGHRERAMSFVSERPSRAGWITAAVIGVLILIGGSIKVASPTAPASAPPAPVVAAEAPPAAEPQEDAKVVTFGDNQGVSIKPKAEPKAEAKPEPKRPAAHVVTVKPVVKTAPSSKLPDGSLALGSKDDKKDEKVPATSHDSPSSLSKAEKADQKRLKSIEQDLADLQLKAAAR